MSANTLTIDASQVKYINSAYYNTSNVKQVLDMIPNMINGTIVTAEQYTDQKISDLIGGAGPALDTLKELGDALNADENALAAINLNLVAKVDKVAGKGLSTNDYDTPSKAKVDLISVTHSINLDTIGSQSHTHNNLPLLETYTQTELNLADAVSKKHSHTNKAVLDVITDTNGHLYYNGVQMATKKDAIKFALVF